MRWLVVFLASLFCFCTPCYASVSTNLFKDSITIPDIPDDESRPYIFVVYYPHTDKYIMVQSAQQLVFKSLSSVQFDYYMDLTKCDFKSYQWFPDSSDTWVSGGLANTAIASWYAWVGYGGCTDAFDGAKRILYSNYSVRNEADDSVMFYQTPLFAGLNWQWAFTGLIQQVYNIVLPVLVRVCILLCALFVVQKSVRKLERFWKGR